MRKYIVILLLCLANIALALERKYLPPQVSDASEVMHLKLWEGTAFDYSLNGNSGTLSGTTFYGFPGVDLDGISGKITVGDSGNLSFGNGTTDKPFSISAWINMDNPSSFKIMHKRAGGQDEWEFRLLASKLQFIILHLNLSAVAGRLYNTALTANIWYHVVATYDGSGGANARNGMKIYLDGTRVDDTDGQATGTYTAMTAGTSNVVIGFEGTTYSNGTIDDVRIYSTERSAAQIKDFYEQTRWRYQK